MLRRVLAGQEIFNVRQNGKFEQVAQPFAIYPARRWMRLRK